MVLVGIVLRIPAQIDYAVRALAVLARHAPDPVKGDRLADEEDIPFRFLEVTLGQLRHAGLVASRRGADGGYWLARAAEDITLDQILIAIEGALVDVRSLPPGSPSPASTRSRTHDVWQRAEHALGSVFGSVTLASLAGVGDDR